MKSKNISYSLRNLDDQYWQTVREFSVHHRITIKAMILHAIDEYMARHKRKERKQNKEVKTHDRHNNRPG